MPYRHLANGWSLIDYGVFMECYRLLSVRQYESSPTMVIHKPLWGLII